MFYKKILFIILLLCTQSLASNITNDHIRYLAGVIYAEANNETYYGKSLVATTIWLRSGQNSHNIFKTVTIPKQFATPKFGYGDKWNECMELSKEMYNNTFKPESVILGNGNIIQPDHFFHGRTPWWARGRIFKKVGGLKFLRLDSYRRKL